MSMSSLHRLLAAEQEGVRVAVEDGAVAGQVLAGERGGDDRPFEAVGVGGQVKGLASGGTGER
ncbi:hypothetical protein ACWCPX_43220 [Streptomyces olivaceoviridis]